MQNKPDVDWPNSPLDLEVFVAGVETDHLSGPIAEHLVHFADQRALKIETVPSSARDQCGSTAIQTNTVHSTCVTHTVV